MFFYSILDNSEAPQEAERFTHRSWLVQSTQWFEDWTIQKCCALNYSSFSFGIKLLSTASCSNGTFDRINVNNVMFNMTAAIDAGLKIDGGNITAEVPKVGEKLDLVIDRPFLDTFEVCDRLLFK